MRYVNLGRRREKKQEMISSMVEKQLLVFILSFAFFLFLCLLHVLVDTQCRLTRLRYHFLWLSFILYWTFLFLFASPGIWYKIGLQKSAHCLIDLKLNIFFYYESYLKCRCKPRSFLHIRRIAGIHTDSYIYIYIHVPLLPIMSPINRVIRLRAHAMSCRAMAKMF